MIGLIYYYIVNLLIMLVVSIVIILLLVCDLSYMKVNISLCMQFNEFLNLIVLDYYNFDNFIY